MRSFFIALLVSLCTAFFSAAQASTLDQVKSRGYVTCGVTTGFSGFSAPDSKGQWHGLDVDMCRAVAAAVLGDANKVKLVPLNSQQRFTALQSGEIDVLTRNTTISLTRDTQLGILAVGVNFYDGQGFLINKNLGITHADDLSGATICMQAGTSDEKNIANWAAAHHIDYKPIVFDQFSQVVNAFASGRCDVYTTDASGLASIRISKLSNPDQYVLLPEQISRSPLGPFVRQGDDQWFNIVKWSLQAMLNAEALGVTSKNVDQLRKQSVVPAVKYLLGVIPGIGKGLGLSDQWAYQLIKAVGNYGESFERNVGKDSPLHLPRGLNALYTQGGLMYPLPLN